MVEGECHIGGQEHFYLETQASVAVPKGEDGELEMFVSTQNPTETQVRHYISTPMQCSLYSCKINNFQMKYFDSFLIFAENENTQCMF